ncbi:MAG: PAC2 family protein [Dehalococcoidia bacterium]
MADYLTFDQHPKLNRPVLIMAFEGWNDAADAASGALEILMDKLGATHFASIDPEEFYSFTDTRPTVRLVDDIRELEWPSIDFSFHNRGDGGRDLLFLQGSEPQLKWRTFTGLVSGLAEELEVSMVVSLGALLAEVPHTHTVRVTGGSSDPELGSILGLERSTYEGPTGILGVLHQSLREKGLPSVSLWANVPHYIPALPNPRASKALLGRVGALLDLKLDLADLDERTTEFDEQIQQGLAQNPEVAQYVRELESRVDDEDEAPRPAPELPTGESLVADLEKYLRAQREGGRPD